jgi:hypothetical protein
LESLESLAKLTNKKRDEVLKLVNFTKVEGPLTMCRISIHNNSHSKTLHLLVELSNNLLEGLLDIGAFMSIISVVVVHELGIIHLVSGVKIYKTTFGVVTQAFGWIIDFPIKDGDVQRLMMFMIIDINSYDLLLSPDFLIKIGEMVDVKKSLTQIKQGPGNNVQVLPLNMVNMLHLVWKAII